jgi:hypothetical protein
MTRYDPRQPVPDPKQAVIAYLLYANAEASTIHFVKERSTPHFRIYGMKYEDITGQQRYCLCFLTRDESGLWSIGRAIFPDPVDEGEMNNIDKSRPRFILLGKDIFTVFGHIIDPGSDVARVRLVCSNGLMLEDRVEDALVLFSAHQRLEKPFEVELYNHSGALLSTRTLPDRSRNRGDNLSGTAYPDPKQAIIEALSNATGKPAYARETLRTHGLIAGAATIRFLKACSRQYHQLHAVTFENELGQTRTCLCFLGQQESGLWQVITILFNGPENVLTEQEQDTSRPWVRISGGIGKVPLPARYPFRPWGLWGGCEVIDHGFDVTRVRLVSSDGLVFEDQVEHGLVMFLVEQSVQRPVEAQLYNRSGMLVGMQTVFPAREPHHTTIDHET